MVKAGPASCAELGAGVAPEPHGRGAGVARAGDLDARRRPLGFADALLAELSGEEPKLVFTHRHTAGSAENTRMLSTGTADMAIVAGETATSALAGENAPMVLAALY